MTADAATDAIDRLAELVPPPRQVPRVDWAAAEARFGLRFPAGYRALVDRYGPGVFGGDFELLVPGDYLEESLELDDETQQEREVEGSWRYPLRPAPGSLVVWLKTGHATEVHWVVGSADERQVYLSYKEDWAQELSGSPAEVLLAFVTGQAVSQDYLEGEFRAVFEPQQS